MYYSYQDFYKSIEDRIQELEMENRRLKELLELESEALKHRIEQIKPIHIENINYKIQELIVRELKGTLNIGMTGVTDPEQIQKWLNESNHEEGIQLQDMSQPQEDEES